MKLEDINLVDLQRFEQGFPDATFDLLREQAPVWWHPPVPEAPGGEGFWVLSRHAEVMAVLNDAQRFSSERGGDREAGGTTLDDFPEGIIGSMLNMTDPPKHRRLRLLVNKAFKPSTLRALESQLEQRTTEILDAVADRGECDFLMDVAVELPMQLITSMLGLPQADRHDLLGWILTMMDYSDRELGQSSDRMIEAAVNMHEYGEQLIEAKRRNPGDDMMSIVTHAEVPNEQGEMEKLSHDDIKNFFQLLIVAGAETTRNGIAHGLYALLNNPEQLALLREHPGLLDSTATEEILRWTSPTTYNRRTATEDVELLGQQIRAGDKVTIWYPSANRDAAVFDEPYRFDLRREPNPHVAFGHGIHHCLGASLARMEIAIMFRHLLPRFSRIEMAGDIEWCRSNKHNGVRHMPVRLAV